MRRKLVDPETRTFVDQVHSANIRRPEYLSTQIFVDPNICQPKYSSTWIVLFSLNQPNLTRGSWFALAHPLTPAEGCYSVGKFTGRRIFSHKSTYKAEYESKSPRFASNFLGKNIFKNISLTPGYEISYLGIKNHTKERNSCCEKPTSHWDVTGIHHPIILKLIFLYIQTHICTCMSRHAKKLYKTHNVSKVNFWGKSLLVFSISKGTSL
jgi:hypothetical protein